MHMPGSGGWDDEVVREERRNTTEAVVVRETEIASILARDDHYEFPVTQFVGTPALCVEQ